VFEAAVFRGTEEIGSGSGRTKKQAEQAAALAALKNIQDH
jgi:dsRNA-specific ribonuclease